MELKFSLWGLFYFAMLFAALTIVYWSFFQWESSVYSNFFRLVQFFFCCAILIIRVERRARMKSTACGFSLVLRATKGKWTFWCNCNAINLMPDWSKFLLNLLCFLPFRVQTNNCSNLHLVTYDEHFVICEGIIFSRERSI